MRVLVSAGSRHGATTEIARAIADVLASKGHRAQLVEPIDVDSLQEYEAAVIGSAVYAGHWLEPVKRLIERERERLLTIPVWMFSSGPVGDPPKPDEPAVDASLAETIQAHEHRTFGGRIERAKMGFAERAVVAALRVPDGDFRDWSAIRAWATSIATTLSGLQKGRDVVTAEPGQKDFFSDR